MKKWPIPKVHILSKGTNEIWVTTMEKGAMLGWTRVYARGMHRWSRSLGDGGICLHCATWLLCYLLLYLFLPLLCFALYCFHYFYHTADCVISYFIVFLVCCFIGFYWMYYTILGIQLGHLFFGVGGGWMGLKLIDWLFEWMNEYWFPHAHTLTHTYTHTITVVKVKDVHWIKQRKPEF